MALRDWSTYLDFVRAHSGLDAKWGTLHQGAALLTWVDSLDAEGQPVYRYTVDHPGEFDTTPSRVDPLPDFDNRYVRLVSNQQRVVCELVSFPKIGGIWSSYPITERVWGAGDLAIVVVVASEAALNDMVSAGLHLPLMRVYVDPEQGDDAAFAPALPFPQGHVTVISDWFADLGANGNPKYTGGLTPAQVANFFGQYYPAITSAADMSAWMQTHPRSDSIGAFGEIFEYAP